MTEKSELQKHDKNDGDNLCKGCPITAVAICQVCQGKNGWLVNQIIRDLTEAGMQLYVTM